MRTAAPHVSSSHSLDGFHTGRRGSTIPSTIASTCRRVRESTRTAASSSSFYHRLPAGGYVEEPELQARGAAVIVMEMGAGRCGRSVSGWSSERHGRWRDRRRDRPGVAGAARGRAERRRGDGRSDGRQDRRAARLRGRRWQDEPLGDRRRRLSAGRLAIHAVRRHLARARPGFTADGAASPGRAAGAPPGRSVRSAA